MRNTGPTQPIVRHPVAVTDAWEPEFDGVPGVAGPVDPTRGPEHRVAAFTLALLLVLGGLMGSINLFVDDVLRDGPHRWLYAVTMAVCVLTAVPLVILRRVTRGPTLALVLLGDLIYLVVVFCIDDPVRYATPLMLLFPSFVAAWFLGRVELAVNMVVTTLVCLVALWPSYDSAIGLAVQVGVFLLRRRIERLLVATRTMTLLDPLTGLYNRRHLVAQAPRLWRQARREGTRVAAMVLDLDHFKRINDAHGHAAGDAVLRAVAASLTASVRPTDVLARTGGEELVVLGLVGDPDEAARLAERLRTAVANTRTADGHAVTASVGIALTRPVDTEDAADELWRLVDRADAAMYEAKQQGRDRVASLWVPRARAPMTADTGRPGPAPSDVV